MHEIAKPYTSKKELNDSEPEKVNGCGPING